MLFDRLKDHAYAIHQLQSGYFYVVKLGKYLKVDDVKQIEKLKNDKISLKRHLKVTRHNNGIFKKMVDELKTKNEEIKVQLQKSEMKVEELGEEVKKLKNELNLNHCNKTNTDLIMSKQETKECTEELEVARNRNLKCQSENNTAKQELESEVKNVRNQNLALLKSLEELKKKNVESEMKVEKLEVIVIDLKTNKLKIESDLKNCESAGADLKMTQHQIKACQDKLEEGVEEKENIIKKFDSICPSWNESSECSNSDHMGACNQNSSSLSGKF